MSLFCAECKQGIEYGDPLYAAARSDMLFFAVLSEEAVSQIPKEDRCPHPYASDKGMGIYVAFSTLNFTETYTIRNFRKGEFLFSIPEDVAKKHLPRVYDHFQRREAP